jgi:nitrogen fixation NifU-like protein
MSDCLDLRDLYHDAILEHGRHPRNRRVLADCSHRAHGDNPLCGDAIDVFVKTDEDGVIREAAFDGQVCAIATASASLMTEMLTGKTPPQAKSLFDCVHALTTGEEGSSLNGMKDELERLSILSGLRDYPERRECAALPWRTLFAALGNHKG